jgi:hypothetical protein
MTLAVKSTDILLQGTPDDVLKLQADMKSCALDQEMMERLPLFLTKPPDFFVGYKLWDLSKEERTRRAVVVLSGTPRLWEIMLPGPTVNTNVKQPLKCPYFHKSSRSS